MNVDNVTREDWILGAVALLLVIDLVALPWFDINAGFASVTLTATGTPDGWLGILAVLAAIAVIVDVAIERMSPQTTMPALGSSRATTRLALAGAAVFFVALKFLFHIHFSLFGFGFWIAVVLSVALIVLALRARQLGAGARPYSGTGPGSTPPPGAVA